MKEGMETIVEPKKVSSEFTKLLNIIDQATRAYKIVVRHYSDKKIDKFIDDLAKHHNGFVKKACDKLKLNNFINSKNQAEPGMAIQKESAIDVLMLCMEMEKKILQQAREAVRECKGNTKLMLCKHLTYTEDALFKADQMLEIYE